HSGLASLQIGYMRCIGYRVPERYRLPFLATSPQDFWRRWNTWIGRWGYRYVFFPTCRGLARSSIGRNSLAVAAIATFVVIGLLHDLGIYALRGIAMHAPPSLRMTFVFGVAGLAFAAFGLLARLARRMHRIAELALTWLLWLHVALGFAWLAI